MLTAALTEKVTHSAHTSIHTKAAVYCCVVLHIPILIHPGDVFIQRLSAVNQTNVNTVYFGRHGQKRLSDTRCGKLHSDRTLLKKRTR